MSECQFEEALMEEIEAANLAIENNADDLSSEAIARIAARTDLDDVILWMSEALTDQFKKALCDYKNRDEAELGRMCVSYMEKYLKDLINDNWQQANACIEASKAAEIKERENEAFWRRHMH
jgi:hypothetical protein